MSLESCLPVTIQPFHADLQDEGAHGDPGQHLWAGLWGSSLAILPSSRDEADSLALQYGWSRFPSTANHEDLSPSLCRQSKPVSDPG